MKKYSETAETVASSVKYYCRKYRLKITLLETEIGVSPGYFARTGVAGKDILFGTVLRTCDYINENSKANITVYDLLVDHGDDIIRDEIAKRQATIDAEQEAINKLKQELRG